MLKTIYAENSELFYLMQKTNFMNVVSRFEYTVNMMCREQILLIVTTISLGVLWENSEQFFKQWTENNLHRKESEQFFK